ncbi:ATP-binding protein [Dyella sp.]|uniref:ATP-binding protein n=1 Tax=Dyella sp. TaxID=1869338 RepID=UPI002D795BE0|nr:ATP-binding protein [Dyella sp.]HET7332245.1 ATP-binding protein [Dyella sp.]
MTHSAQMDCAEELFQAGSAYMGAPGADDGDLFECAPLGYMLLDATGCIQRINRHGATLLGREPSRLVGKPFSRWVVNSDKQLFYAHQCEVRRGEEDSSQQLRIKDRHGRVVSLCLRSSGDGDGGCRTVMIDISGEQRCARELRQLQAQLAHVTRLNTVGELASSLARELDQPLGTVVLNCEAALRLLERGGAADYEFVRALTGAREAASLASEAARHLRGFRRKNEQLHKPCELRSLIQRVSALISADASDNDMELRLNLEQHLPPVRVDAAQIEQVLLNLARNGIEAMRECDNGPRELTISAHRDTHGCIRVSVADTGPGLDTAQRERIFEPFYTTRRNGMGVGLSISRSIVEAHGGQLWAAHEFGDGAILHFTLPVDSDRCGVTSS